MSAGRVMLCRDCAEYAGVGYGSYAHSGLCFGHGQAFAKRHEGHDVEDLCEDFIKIVQDGEQREWRDDEYMPGDNAVWCFGGFRHETRLSMYHDDAVMLTDSALAKAHAHCHHGGGNCARLTPQPT